MAVVGSWSPCQLPYSVRFWSRQQLLLLLQLLLLHQLLLQLPMLLLRQLATGAVVGEMKFPFNCCNRLVYPHMLHMPHATCRTLHSTLPRVMEQRKPSKISAAITNWIMWLLQRLLQAAAPSSVPSRINLASGPLTIMVVNFFFIFYLKGLKNWNKSHKRGLVLMCHNWEGLVKENTSFRSWKINEKIYLYLI